MPVTRDEDGNVIIGPNIELMGALQSASENLAIALEVEDPEDLYGALLSVAIAGFLVINGNRKPMLTELIFSMVNDISEQLTHHDAGHPSGKDVSVEA